MGALRCNALFYHPDGTFHSSPEKFGFQKDEIFVPSLDGTKLHVWEIAAYGKPVKGTIVQFHGNAQNMSSHFVSLIWLANEGYNLVTFDYRGYGQSEGTPTREGIYMDARAILERYHKIAKAKNQALIVYAQSLGGAIALRAVPDMTDRSMLKAMVVDGAFASYQAIAVQKAREQCFWPIPLITAKLIDDDLSPLDNIARISPTPLIVIHGDHDEVVAFENGQDVYRRAQDPKIFLEVRNGGHLDWMKLGATPNARNFLTLLDHIVTKGAESSPAAAA
ncbi:MAG: alpha/beta hydrolase [Spirochaetia bacterium]|nr:alpha/beta hydrolase [Spirochaetia bacterium]